MNRIQRALKYTTGYVKSELKIFILFEATIVLFGLLNMIDRGFGKSRVYLLTVVYGCLAAMILVAVVYRFRQILKPAFFMPLILFLVYTTLAAFLSNLTYFFSTCLGICSLGALYLDHRRLKNYIIISNIICFILVILKIPMIQPDRTLTFTETILHWFIAFMGSLFIYMVTAFASERNSMATQARDSFSALLAATPNRIVLLDNQNRITYASKSFIDLTNFKHRRHIIDRQIFDILKDADAKELFQSLLTNEGLSQETKELTLNGERGYFNIITNDLSNETQGRVINIIDITPVMKAKYEAEEASRSKSSFLATMSHEIRTPLNAIIGLSEIELQKKLPVETRQDLEKIYTSGGSLLSIINDILDISKIEAGSFELIPAEYDLPSMVNDTIHLNIVRIGHKNITFELKIDETMPVKLFGDEVRVKQILNNLLSNAFKYTEEGKVVLQIDWDMRDEGALLKFSVSDTGRGIRKEDISRLFDEYTQLDTRANRHIEGTGLGLSITKNLVELMNGTILVDSEYGKGSTFYVRIIQQIVDKSPIGETTAKNLQFFRFMDSRHSRILNLVRAYMPYGRVLVADDVETNLDVAKGLMLPYGLFIDCASSGQIAINKIRAVCNDPALPKYDLVLMDHMMPEMDGIEAVHIIRNQIDSDYARTVPIIALTANALAGNEEMFLAHGFNAYISKPIDIMQLDVALNTWVKNKQSKETLLQAEMEQAVRAEANAKTVPSILDGLLVDGIDLVLGKERYNNEAAYLDILRSYYIHTPELLEKMGNLSNKPGGLSLEDYTVTIHGLKGSSYGICANVIGKKAEELETAARAGNFAKVLKANRPFIEQVKLMLAELGLLLQKAAAHKEDRQQASAPDSALLAKLLDAVIHYKSTVMEEILCKLESYEYQSGGELVTWLREQMDNLEYDIIRKRLEKEQ